jgi:hypothetical protein
MEGHQVGVQASLTSFPRATDNLAAIEGITCQIKILFLHLIYKINIEENG